MVAGSSVSAEQCTTGLDLFTTERSVRLLRNALICTMFREFEFRPNDLAPRVPRRTDDLLPILDQ